MILVFEAHVLLKVEEFCLLRWLLCWFLVKTSMGKHSFRNTSVSLSGCISLLFKRIRHINRLSAQILPIHLCNCCVRSLKIVEGNKPILLAAVGLRVTHNFSRYYDSKLAKHLLELFFINSAGQISNKYVSAHLLSTLVLARLIHFNRLSKKLDHVKQLNTIVSINLIFELDKAVVLVLICHLVSGDVNMHDGACLQKQLPN
jgi:hypothetical protein